MTARKGTTRPKRKASASSGPKRKRKVAAKDGKTPQEIARDILIKNGLLPTATREVRSTTPVKGKCGETLTREQRELIEERRRAALERRRFPSSSPGMLTKEQRERIEKRRQEALKKRRQTLQSAGANNARPTVADLATDAGSNRQQSRSWIEPSPAVQQRSRVVTPDNLPTANLAAEVDRSEFFWDDLEAAAEIVQWENEHMAKVALVRPPANTYNQELNTTEYGRGQQIQQGRQRPAISTIPSLSQELAAAAEIIEWEKKHEDSPEKSGKLSCHGDEQNLLYLSKASELSTKAFAASLKPKPHNSSCYLYTSLRITNRSPTYNPNRSSHRIANAKNRHQVSAIACVSSY
ncbi:hypothetical protein DVH05_006821 [Phytophthora capsici]|nr:hypothetical protein DVH05_006821 [Phytophthora capsici]